jgi:8-oxo-dGTP diphosphatase
MTLAGQRVQPDRYTIIPRTITFLLRGSDVLLLRISETRGAWAGKLNGVGGHIERGETPAGAAIREIREETGLRPTSLKLCGIVMIDAGGIPGIGLYVFVGLAPDGSARPGPEGTLEWRPYTELEDLELVSDLPALLPRAIESYKGSAPFTALTSFDENGNPELTFDP